MRDPNRIEPTLELLWKVWLKDPDLRLGQIIVNAVRPTEPCPQIFYAEDDKVAQGLEEMLKCRREAAP